MKRRKFLLVSATGLTAVATGFRLPSVRASDYRGRLLVSVQADGGWDVTSFCDPKANTQGEPIINHWAERAEIQQAGSIPYAPFAHNEGFFEKYYERMLVINGVDAQTNSHTVGVVHNWSGRNAEGYPTLAATLASGVAPEQPISYISFGGYAETGGLIRYTRLDNPHLLSSVAYPRGETDWGEVDENAAFFTLSVWRAMEAHRSAAVERLSAMGRHLPTKKRHLSNYLSSFETTEELQVFADSLPPGDQLEQPVNYSAGKDHYWSELHRQAQLAVLAFKAGVAVGADLFLGGFDTHTRNDKGQDWLLSNLADGIDYLWDYAESHGIADRLIVVIGSDFGRTNFYNSDDGKDHWPIGSFVIMEKNQPWTNRVVGETDDLHFAHRINPTTLKRDDANGTIIYPKHVHKALRRYLGIENTPGAQRFPFNNAEDFAFFG